MCTLTHPLSIGGLENTKVEAIDENNPLSQHQEEPVTHLEISSSQARGPASVTPIPRRGVGPAQGRPLWLRLPSPVLCVTVPTPGLQPFLEGIRSLLGVDLAFLALGPVAVRLYLDRNVLRAWQEDCVRPTEGSTQHRSQRWENIYLDSE